MPNKYSPRIHIQYSHDLDQDNSEKIREKKGENIDNNHYRSWIRSLDTKGM